MELALTSMIALNVIPHPDDEAIACPATLLTLRDLGYRVVILACSLGRPEQEERRRAELLDAGARAGYEVIVMNPPIAMSSSTGDDLAAAQKDLRGRLGEVVARLKPQLVLSPHVEDVHPAHELVARATRGALEDEKRNRPIWWQWGVWGELPIPTVYVPFSEERMQVAQHVLAAHSGELDRIDYPVLVTGRSVANTVLGAEKVFGFGSGSVAPEPYAELLTELLWTESGWELGTPRVLRGDPAAAPRSKKSADWLLDRRSAFAELQG